MRETFRELAACAIGLFFMVLIALGPAVVAKLIAGVQRLSYSWPP